MSELSDRMIQDMKLAGLVKGTRREYLRAVRQLAGYYMISPDRLTERQVQDYILYVRDDLGVAKGTFAPLLAGLKFFYLNTLGYEWPLLSKKRFLGRICGLILRANSVSPGICDSCGSRGTADFWRSQTQVRVPLLCSVFSDTLRGPCWVKSYGRFHRR